MRNLKVCTVCLNAEGNLYNMDRCNLRLDYNLVSGLKTQKTNGLPAYLCVECTAYVRRYKSFRVKCQRANFALQAILQQENEISTDCIEAINRHAINIAPTLAFSDHRRSKYETVKFKWVKASRPRMPHLEDLTIMHCNTIDDVMFEAPPRKKLKLSEKIKYEPESVTLKQEQEETEETDLVSDDENTLFKDGELNKDNNDDNVNDEDDDDDDDDYFAPLTQRSDDDNDNIDISVNDIKPADVNEDNTVDGSSLEEEYAIMVPITTTEAKAALDVYNLFTTGQYKCNVCNRGYTKQSRLDSHARMHDKHVNGTYQCKLCNFYYRTDFLLSSHMTEKHMYKYICRKCPEVNFDRTSAKQHFIWAHLQLGPKRCANWYESKPKWVGPRGGTRPRAVARLRPVRKNQQLPKDYIKISPISPLEQYQLVADRRKSRNYTASRYKCEYCYRGFREEDTYSKHMEKHDASKSGPLQCDMCKLHFPTARVIYKHMIVTHLYRYACVKCDFVSYNRGQAIQHYRWHKNVTYKCGQCDLVFRKHSTRLTHIRIKHPSTVLCNICGHSFVSSFGLSFHQKKAHSREEIARGKATRVDKQSSLYCAECKVQFLSDTAFVTHLGSSSKHSATNLSIQHNEINRRRKNRGYSGLRKSRGLEQRPLRKRANNDLIVNNGQPTGHDCELCGIPLPNDVKARVHYNTHHPGYEFLKRYMCDVCGHTTKQYANLMVHMRTHTREKPYACTHCDRRFSMPSNRDRHLVVHTGEKKYECEHCHRRFTQSSAVKLHIQTVHLKIPYAPWDKKNRKRRKEMEAALPQPEPKLLLDASGDYINAYITYEQP